MLVLAACQRQPASVVRGPRVPIGMMSMYEEQELQWGRYSLPAGGMLILAPFTERAGEKRFHQALMEEGISYSMGTLRNPGRRAFLIPKKGGPIPTKEVRAKIEALTREHRGKVVTRGEMPIRFGPDGYTPLVLKDLPIETSNAPKPRDVSVLLGFPSVAVAKKAATYIDPSAYQISIQKVKGGAELHAVCRGDWGDPMREQTAFQPLVEKFDGRLKWTGATTESTEPG